MSKRKEKTPDISPTPFDIGLKGTVKDMRKAIDDAQVAYEEVQGRYSGYNAGGLFSSLKKFYTLRDERDSASARLQNLKIAIVDGAKQAFLEGRPENVQEIMAAPETFITYGWEKDNLRVNLLSQILDKVPDAGVPPLALVRVEPIAQEKTINAVLFETLRNQTDTPEKISALLEYGARVDSWAIIAATSGNQPDAIITLLAERGGGIEAAQAVMKASEDGDSDSYYKLEFIRYKTEAEATIRELRDNVRDLTERLEGRNPVAPMRKNIRPTP